MAPFTKRSGTMEGASHYKSTRRIYTPHTSLRSMPQNVSNTQTGLGNVGGETYDGGRGILYQYAPRPQQPHWDGTNNDHTVGGNTLHDSNNTGVSGDVYAINALAAGADNNAMLPPSFVYPYPGRLENSQSTHTPVHYSTIYGNLPSRASRRPPVSILTDVYPPTQPMGFPRHQVPMLSGDGSGNTLPSSHQGSHESGQMHGQDNQLQIWSSHSVPTSPVQPQSTSPPKAVLHRTRKGSQRHLNSRYTDPLLLQKYPEERHCALKLAIQFREDCGSGALIPNDLINELLEGPDDGKYYCFCCPRARKSRTIASARDHVRKSLGNYSFKCSNTWCQHSSLRSADLTKHMKTCVSGAAPQ